MTSAMPAAIPDFVPITNFHSPAHSAGGSTSPPASFIGSFPLTTPSLKIFEMDPKLVPKARKSGGGNKKGTSAERRATHNAVERARRESLNVRFLELAGVLPSTAGVRRPSKNLIAKKSLAFVTDALARETMYRERIQDMARENEALREELNVLRQRNGAPPLAPRADVVLPPPMTEVSGTGRSRNDSTTSIGNGFGELGFGGDDEDDYGSGGSEGGLGAGDSPYGGHQPAYTHGAQQPFSQVHHYADHHAPPTIVRGAPPSHLVEGPYAGSETAYSAYSNDEGPNASWGASYADASAHSYSPPPTRSLPNGSVGHADPHHDTVPYHEMPPITPTTAMIFNNVLASLEMPDEASPPQHYEVSPPHHSH